MPAAGSRGGGDDDLVPSILDQYGVRAKQRLGQYLRGQGDGGGHLAYLYDHLRDYPSRGGRSLRPSLCIASAKAFGGTLEDALDSAVALEIMHNAFLIHDDVEDLSEQRRGRPTLHQLHGVPLAVNAGDAMTVLGLRPLLDNGRTLGPRTALRILEEAERMGREAVEGQAMELGWRRENAVDLDEADYLRMVLKKTCSYTTIFPMRVGAIVAGRDDGEGLDRLSQFSFFLGSAFQIQDDLLNLVGDPEDYGKETAGDLWEGKRTLMLIHLLGQVDGAERDWLRAIMGAPRAAITVADVTRMRRLMDRHGSIEYGRAFAHACAGAALHEFSLAFSGVRSSRDRDFIERLCTWVIERA
ncbi:MAG TPA: polyprenyl synthetase family protein [Polyangia bacterium]|nr:polyprenyl synthetase family protein [Polyangia bacterium]